MSNWAEFTAVSEQGAREADALGAAQDDLRADYLQQFIPAKAGEPSALRHESSLVAEPFLRLEVKVYSDTHERTVWFTRDTIAAVAAAPDDRGGSPITLVAVGFVAKSPLAPDWQPQRVGEARPSSDLFDAYRSVTPTTTVAISRTLEFLQAGRDVLLVGEHGSGKSGIAAHIAQTLQRQSHCVVWLNLSDPADGPESIIATLLTSARAERYLIVMDNLHANPDAVRGVLACVADLRARFGLEVRVLGTAWAMDGEGPAAERLKDYAPQFRQTNVHGDDTVRAFVTERGLEHDAALAIQELARGDVHIAATALTLFRENRVMPTVRDLEAHYAAAATDPAEQEALYRLACLGTLGMELSVWDVQGIQGTIDALLRKSLVLKTDRAYSVGNPRRAGLILGYARRVWQTNNGWQDPAEVVSAHVQNGGMDALKATLRRLTFYDGLDPSDDETSPLKAQRSLEALGRRILNMSMTDPTWKNDLGPAVFAAVTLARLGYNDVWLEVAQHIRARWVCNPDADSVEPIDDHTIDLDDFQKIVTSMGLEEQQPLMMPSNDMRAANIDINRFYRSWALGLLLYLEGTAPADHHDQDRVETLISIARKAQDPDGYFYPRRVPWITARIVIGLCENELGRRDRLVGDACDWLLRDISEGGPLDTWWRSGTGSWNTDEATTAMCLTALVRADTPKNQSRKMTLAYDWLIGREASYNRQGYEVDLATVMETTVLCDGQPERWQRPLFDLLPRINEDLQRPPAEDRPESRLRVPFVASQLASLVWQLLRMKYRSMIEHAMRTYDIDEPGEAIDADALDEGDVQTKAQSIPTQRHVGAELSESQRAQWKDACARIRRRIDEQIQKRTEVVDPGPRVLGVLDQFKAYGRQLDRLVYEFNTECTDDTLDRIDELGHNVLKGAWNEPPRPRTVDDQSLSQRVPGDDGDVNASA